MGKTEQSNRWFSGWRSSTRPQEEDPADMGTAFGLDLSLNVLHPETPPAPAARPASWVSRLTQRRKSA
jgi:hypothetical protein